MSAYRPVPLEFQRLPEDEMVARARAYADAMARRRTVRAFSPDPFPPSILDDAIRAAASAPSGAHQQPWTFVVITDPERKRRIREAAEAEERESYDRRMSDEWLAALAPLGVDWRKPHLTEAPALIVVFAQPYGLGDGPDGPRKVKHYYVDESVGIAVGMLLSTLHLAGLATLTHTPSPMGFLNEVLQRPPNEKAFLLLVVGYPAADAKVPDIRRKPLGTICSWS
jgi:iodotyrosine deiodinase